MNYDERQIGINHLPDEILEKILIEATINLEGSMMAAAVCRRWRRIMATRLSMVKYLLQDQWSIDSGHLLDEGLICIPKASFLFLHENGSHPEILKTCLEWLPNLMVNIGD
uniref:Uncharacterized protein n=1 Tax=Tetranychus urticae TaxID=32264 RepID=T1KC26_TETUR